MATPQQWAYEGDFVIDTLTPNPAPYPGLVIADGITVLPLLDALRQGLIDVPTIIATVQCENNLEGAPSDVMNWTSVDFDHFVDVQFRAWPATVGPRIFELYENMSASNAGFAFGSMTSDTTMTCGNAAVAVAAGLGFSSPVYLAMNSHWPSHPIYSSSPSDAPRVFPFHTWDTTNAFATYSGKEADHESPWKPHASDLAYGENLRQLWFALARDGVLPAPYLSVKNVSNFPHS